MIRKLAVLAMIVAIAGTLLSITLRDVWHPLGMLFYATPWLVRLSLAVLSLVILRRQKTLALIGAACAILSAYQGMRSFGRPIASSATNPPALSVSVWNAARKLNERPAQWSSQGNADISALVETGHFSDEAFRRFKEMNPSHEWRILDKGTMIGIRGTIDSVEDIGVSSRYRCFRVMATVAGNGTVPIYVIDIRSSLWISREPALRKILEAAAADPAAILLGDFNTPLESRWLDPWREAGFHPANEGNHSGFRETWAFGVPLLSLDQIWAGKNWRSLSTSTSLPAGDHSRVEARMVEAR